MNRSSSAAAGHRVREIEGHCCLSDSLATDSTTAVVASLQELGQFSALSPQRKRRQTAGVRW